MKKKPVAKKKADAKKTVPAKKAVAPKKKPVRWLQEGYSVLTPYLAIAGAAEAIEFYKKAFGARERMRMGAPGGPIGHAELQLGDSVIMLADENIELDFRSPRFRGGTAVTLHLYVKDVDAVIAQAVRSGATLLRPAKDEFYGDRNGTVADPFGHVWHIATHIEDVSEAEMRRRMAAFA